MKLNIGESLKRLRIQKNVTQEQLADYLNVTYQAVSRWENGLTYPDIELLPELANFFSVSLEEIMGSKNGEETAVQKAIRLKNDCMHNNKTQTLSALHELEQQYPNNWEIKEIICETLIDPMPENADDILPELRKYVQEAMKLFPPEKDHKFEWFCRKMILAVPEDEVEKWAAYLDIDNINRRWNLLKIRYQERNDWEKARYYQGLDILGHLENLFFGFEGPIPEIMESLAHDNRYSILTVETSRKILAVMDILIGYPYRDEDGTVHNGNMLYERIGWQWKLCLCYLSTSCCKEFIDHPDALEQGLSELEEYVNLFLLYADAKKADYFISDNPYISPQSIDHYAYMNVAQEDLCRQNALKEALDTLGRHYFSSELQEHPRFKAQLQRLLDKKAELEEYWCKRN